ncbi:MAG TPA: histidine kinase, partial [Coleofasciculaceae cyanobacterium]
MKVEEFNRKIEEWFSHVGVLLQSTDSVATVAGKASQLPVEREQLLTQSYKELHVASEELRIAQEQLLQQHKQLLQQNQELVETRQSLEAERRRYQELFELAPDGYLVTDVSGNIQE